MLESKAYKTYYAIASREKTPKPKLKTSAKVPKSDKKKQPAKMSKAKGLDKLSKSKVPKEQQQKVTVINKGAGVIPKVPNVPKYDSKNKAESWTFSQDDEDDEEVLDKHDDNEETESDNDEDDLTHHTLSTYVAEDLEEEKADEEEESSDQREQEEDDDLYKDVNINLERSDAEMIDAQANQETEDTRVTLTTVPPVVQQQKTPSFVTTIPQPPIPNIQPLQQTQNSITKITSPTMTLPEIPNFTSLFYFDQRVSALETEMFEFKQTSQFTEVVSLISSVVDTYLASKMKEAVDVAVQLQSNKLREEA
nr:hypothetical protein [Tanacetum cinerariifolium]